MTRRFLRRTTVETAVLLVVGLMIFALPVPATAQSSLPLVELTGPTEVGLNEPILLSVVLTRSDTRSVAGWQSSLQFDPEAVIFSGMRHFDGSLSSAGGHLVPMATVEKPGAIWFGAYSCIPLACPHARETVVTGPVTVAMIELTATRPGRIELVLGESVLVTGEGDELRVGGDSLVVQTGEGGLPLLAAPPAGKGGCALGSTAASQVARPNGRWADQRQRRA